MRIGIITNEFPAISETFIINKVLGLRDQGDDIEVVAKFNSKNRFLLKDRTGICGFDFIHNSYSFKNPAYLFSLIKSVLLYGVNQTWVLLNKSICMLGFKPRAFKAFLLALSLAQYKYTIIHFEFSGIAVNYLEALPLLKPAKLIVSCRGAAEKIKPYFDPLRKNNLQKVFQQVDSIHCVSDDMAETIKAYDADPGKIIIIKPAIDVEKFKRAHPYKDKDQGPYQIISVGRLHWKKGHLNSILAVKQLVESGHDVQYEIFGEGQEEEHLRFTINDLDLNNRVYLRGKKSSEEIREALERADIFLLPSVSEGISNAVLEAMAMEVPVVSTDVDGMREVIKDGVDGMLVPARNPAAIAEKAQNLLNDSRLRREMGIRGRDSIEKSFALKQQLQKIRQMYKSNNV